MKVSSAFGSVTWAKEWSIVSVAFCGLVLINVCILLFKEASQVRGEYNYNPASALAMAEFGKLGVSIAMWLYSKERRPTFPDVPAELPWAAVGLATVYAVNNQLTFAILTLTGAGTLALFHSATPTLVAVILWLVYGDKINKLQWFATLVQAAGLVLVADGMGRDGGNDSAPHLDANALLIASAVLTALGSTWNSKALKGIDVPMPVLNIFLYAAGFILNLSLYALRLAYSDQDAFFGGYGSNAFAIAVVVSNSAVGVSTSVVYKYGDAMLSRYAAAVSAAVILVIEAAFLGAHSTKYTYIGAFVVVVSSAIYLDIAIKMPPQAWPFDFPGAVAVARTVSSDDFGKTLKSIKSSEDLLAAIRESEEGYDRKPRRHRSGVELAPPRGPTLRFSRAMGRGFLIVLVICGTATAVCHATGHKTLLFFDSAT